MVSLLNYKAVNEDLQQQQKVATLFERDQMRDDDGNGNGSSRRISDDSRRTRQEILTHGYQSKESIGNSSKLLQNADQTRISRQAIKSNDTIATMHNQANEHQAVSKQAKCRDLSLVSDTKRMMHNHHRRLASDSQYPPLGSFAGMQLGKSSNEPRGNGADAMFAAPGQQQPDSGNFTVTWRNLRFCIEPKWHQKLASGSSRLASLAQRMTKPSSNRNALQVAASTSQIESLEQANVVETQTSMPRVVLDHLDGSFKSGELTAILGPSGAGKTTLLDCLTGHRKSGLSGSIRFSSSASISDLSPTSSNSYSHDCACDCCCCLSAKSTAAQKKPQQNHVVQSTSTTNGENLRVSIIPQNDHLIGHLTVYETLNYASKMKNCFDKTFDHRLNIKRVAQQLGLMSCLGTRINKLSGGQYKRVSIAQELLSSPDILILDEPTSGLDAMTCYQTVQVLRKLTDERSSASPASSHTDGSKEGASGAPQKPIAVILTIHQPNSDVFQQFNHVYVVAQGGKCIYEGPPASIESVINRVGLHLPNSYYNPATMIVEIAAGKFGQDSIVKLNSIQKKQYAQQFATSLDEQNSTSDSAVDCPSSSCSFASSSSHDSDDDHNNNSSSNNNNHDLDANSKTCHLDLGQNNDDSKRQVLSGNFSNHKATSDSFNGSLMMKRKTHGDTSSYACAEGLINKGFVMDNEQCPSREKLAMVSVGTEREVEDNNNLIGSENRNDKCLGGNCCCETNAAAKSMALQPIVHIALATTTTNTHMPTSQKDCLPTAEHTSAAAMIHGKDSLSSCCNIVSSSADYDYACGGHEDATNRANENGRGRKKRRRARRRLAAASSLSASPSNDNDGGGQIDITRTAATGGNGSGGGGGGRRGEKRLKLNSLKADQKFPFWRHTYLHFHRSWLSIVRDPMLCSMQLALHIIVPVMVSLVYGTHVGKPNACPRAGPIDIMAYALEPNDIALQLQEDLRTTLENIGYIFFKLYGIIFAAMTVTVLTFPLDMHVLVKEFRNGWYGLSSYFLGRTLADIPFQLTLPLLAMSLSYYATGQPYSQWQWRFLSITGILILSSLIAQSQGLLFGAILMDRMKAAVFVAPAATTPIILFAGFLVRTQSIPHYLRPLSNLSYLRYAIEACLISRYGFNQCECDPAIFNQTVPELPPIARSMLDYWLSSFKSPPSSAQSDPVNLFSASNNTVLAETTTTAPKDLDVSQHPDLFTKLIDSLARANSFGRNITSCEQVVPYPMIDYDLKDSQLGHCFAILLTMLIFTRLLTFFIVCFKVKRKV